ncbi:MAG: PrgI family protein [Clostridiaceae bacterium]|jgi:hypothetical protein|nr:PrgI family protein [Clostridiaceae bacterium]
MDMKINKEIMDYSEKIFFGLTGRQFFLCLLGLAVSVTLFFVFPFSVDAKLFLCILAITPFALAAFLKIGGLNMEEYLKRWINKVRTPPLKHGNENIYHQMYRRLKYDESVLGTSPHRFEKRKKEE